MGKGRGREGRGEEGRREGEGRPPNVREALTPLPIPELAIIKHPKTIIGCIGLCFSNTYMRCGCSSSSNVFEEASAALHVYCKAYCMQQPILRISEII